MDIVEALLNESFNEVREARGIDAIAVRHQHNWLRRVEFNRLRVLEIGNESRGHHLETTSLRVENDDGNGKP